MREPETPQAFRVLFYMGNVLALSGANAPDSPFCHLW